MSPAEPEEPLPGDMAGDVPQTVQASGRTLLRSTALAAVIAAAVLVVIVLPLEYGFDPTRVGHVFGFTQKGLAKLALAREEIAEEAVIAAEEAAASDGSPVLDSTASSVVDSSQRASTHETTISLQPGEGKEVKLVMRRGARARYSWVTDSGGVNYLTHGDTADAPANAYHTYGRGSDARADSGVIEAAFDGNHGWFWRNRTARSVTVTLRTTGEYAEVKKP